MTNKTNQFVVLGAILIAGLFATGLTASAFAETTVSFGGTYIGYDSDGDDLSGSFVDWGIYSGFGGVVQVHGTYQFVDDESHESGGYFTSQYTIEDREGNSLSFETVEVSWIEYDDGKYGVAENDWKITDGQGKYAGATGEGTESVWYNLEHMSYKGTITGNILLP